MGWNDRLGLTTDEEVEDYIAGCEEKADRDRKDEAEDERPRMRHLGGPEGPEWMVVAPNPWPLAAVARDLGVLDRVGFKDSDYVPDDGRVFVVNLGALLDFPLSVKPNFVATRPEDLPDA